MLTIHLSVYLFSDYCASRLCFVEHVQSFQNFSVGTVRNLDLQNEYIVQGFLKKKYMHYMEVLLCVQYY